MSQLFEANVDHYFIFAVASANRLLVSNPQLSCLAAVSVRRDVKKENNMIVGSTLLSAGCIKPFSVSSKVLAQAGSDYSKLWTVERALAVAMVPLVPAAFYIASPAMDYLLAFTFTLHAHW